MVGKIFENKNINLRVREQYFKNQRDRLILFYFCLIVCYFILFQILIFRFVSPRHSRTAFHVSKNTVDKKQLLITEKTTTAKPIIKEVLPVIEADPVILSPTDMPGDMLTFATETASKAVTAFTSFADIAEYLRMKMESRFPSISANWQAHVGTSFSSSVSKLVTFLFVC